MDEMNIKECEAAVEAVRKCESEEELGTLLWNMVELNAGSTFYTSKKLPFTYRVKGRELFCDRKEKSITQATVLRAYKKIREGLRPLGMNAGDLIWQQRQMARHIITLKGFIRKPSVRISRKITQM